MNRTGLPYKPNWNWKPQPRRENHLLFVRCANFTWKKKRLDRQPKKDQFKTPSVLVREIQMHRWEAVAGLKCLKDLLIHSNSASCDMAQSHTPEVHLGSALWEINSSVHLETGLAWSGSIHQSARSQSTPPNEACRGVCCEMINYLNSSPSLSLSSIWPI